MKQLLFCLIFITSAVAVHAQDRWLYWKYKDYDGGINFTVPRIAISTGSLFLNQKSDRKMLRRVHKVRTLVFEGGSPLSNRDFKRFNRKAQRRNLEEVITVRSGQTRVQVMAKERGSVLRKVVVFVNDPEDGFFMVSMRGKIKITDLNKLIKKFKKGDKPLKNIIPDIV